MNSRLASCALWMTILVSPLAAEEGVTIVKLTVEAKPAPVPVLKYRLLPELRDMQQGNAPQAYYKCFMEQNHLYHDKQSVDNRTKWLTCPLAELPDDTIEYGGSSAKQAIYAARLDVCDWQILNQLRTDGIMLLLPDLQQLRSLASVLKVRCRGQVKAGKFDEALKTEQTMFAMARHLGEHPTLIGALVGMAIGNVAIGPLEEMIQQPGSPNLYWALSQLPPSLVDLRKAVGGEQMFELEFRDFSSPEHVWEPEDIGRVNEKARVFVAIISERDPVKEGWEKWAVDRLKDDKWLVDARKDLIGAGLPEKFVKKYPSEQVIFQTLLLKYRIQRDDGAKWLNFPYWVAESERLKAAKSAPAPRIEDQFTASMFAAFAKVHRAQARLDQRLAMLRVVEALRLHAAHSGQWPETLNEITVPLPVDPFTGKPFIYKLELKGPTAIILGTPPKGEEKNAAYNIRYEVTIRK